jgi:chromosomal replication initiation ATPase DnaA
MRLRTVRQPRVKILEIVAQSAARYGVTLGQVLAGSHRHACVMARRQACWDLRQMGLTVEEIGRHLNIHHSAVCYHVAKEAARQKPYDPNFIDESGIWAI